MAVEKVFQKHNVETKSNDILNTQTTFLNLQQNLICKQHKLLQFNWLTLLQHKKQGHFLCFMFNNMHIKALKHRKFTFYKHFMVL